MNIRLLKKLRKACDRLHKVLYKDGLYYVTNSPQRSYSRPQDADEACKYYRRKSFNDKVYQLRQTRRHK